MHLAFALVAAVAAATPVEAGPAASLVGPWSGSGAGEGSPLALTREWHLEFGGGVLRAEMSARGPDGGDVRSRMYWRLAGGRPVEGFWIDAAGLFVPLEPRLSQEPLEVVVDFVDPHAEGGPAPRRWIFRLPQAGGYSEILLAPSGDSWTVLAEVRFRRTGFP